MECEVKELSLLLSTGASYDTFPAIPILSRYAMRTSFLSCFTLVSMMSVMVATSCTYLKEPKENSLPIRKYYGPGEIRANDIEYIAACEVGRIEADGLNYGSNNVVEKDGYYYVSIVARPHIASAQRTVVIDSTGAVVDYKKGWKPYSYRPVKVEEAPLSPVR